LGSKKQSSESHSTTKTDMNQFNQTHQERFTSPEMKRAYGTLLNNAFNNYNSANDLADSLYKDYQSGKSIGDD
jgi:hypothetical protein